VKILLGVSGSIAAYKAAHLTRLLVKGGHEVKVVMTASARDFITPLTLATLSKNPVHSELFNRESGEWVNHVELGSWCDVFLIAPASANLLAKMAHGLCDNLLLTTYLSCTSHVVIAPAMDRDMYQHPATRANLEILKARAVSIIDPEDGELASGLHGIGRMAEPEHIVEFLNNQSYGTKR
jgi:phosphopantothenoylcysteine decarboxylase / phosphopantothenate---cysteine ligase